MNPPFPPDIPKPTARNNYLYLWDDNGNNGVNKRGMRDANVPVYRMNPDVYRKEFDRALRELHTSDPERMELAHGRAHNAVIEWQAAADSLKARQASHVLIERIEPKTTFPEVIVATDFKSAISGIVGDYAGKVLIREVFDPRQTHNVCSIVQSKLYAIDRSAAPIGYWEVTEVSLTDNDIGHEEIAGYVLYRFLVGQFHKERETESLYAIRVRDVRRKKDK